MNRPNTAPRDVRWPSLVVIIWALAFIGLGASAYLAYLDWAQATPPGCQLGGRLDCGAVTSSGYSMLGEVSITRYGVAFFVTLLALFSPWGWAMRGLASWARGITLTGGVGFVFYLVWVELFRIHAICLWCTGVHLVTVAMFALWAWAEADRPDWPEVRDLG